MTNIIQVAGPFRRDLSGVVDAEDITASDTVGFTKGICRAIWVGTTGDITMVLASGTTITLSSVPVGMLVVQASRVDSTGTTASNLVALY